MAAKRKTKKKATGRVGRPAKKAGVRRKVGRPAKKKVGRPAKKKVGRPAKKKVGRPRKHPIELPKRPVGRPRKHPLELVAKKTRRKKVGRRGASMRGNAAFDEGTVHEALRDLPGVHYNAPQGSSDQDFGDDDLLGDEG